MYRNEWFIVKPTNDVLFPMMSRRNSRKIQSVPKPVTLRLLIRTLCQWAEVELGSWAMHWVKLPRWGILQRHTGIFKMWHCLSFQTLHAWTWLIYSKHASLKVFIIILHPTAWYYMVRRCTWLPCLVSGHQACREVSRFFPNGLARTVNQSVDNENTIKLRQLE